MSDHSYASVFPIPTNMFEKGWSESELCAQVCDSIRIEDVSGLIQKTPSNFWIGWSYDHGESEVNRLRNTRYALVRRFVCVDSEEATEKERSKSLLYRLYLSLKVIRATKERFLILHYTLGDGNATVWDSWRNEFDSQLLDCEFGFPLRPGDFHELARISRQSLGILGDRTLPITQATYNLEIGYRAEFFNVQFLIWVVGLDALFKTNKDTTAATVKKRVRDFLGEDFVIYPDPREVGLPRLIGVWLKDALDEIYELRNHFAHGTWPDKTWASKICRPRAVGNENVSYSGMLLEAAAAILRGCLRKILADSGRVEMFNDKPKMDAYFTARGLA